MSHLPTEYQPLADYVDAYVNDYLHVRTRTVDVSDLLTRATVLHSGAFDALVNNEVLYYIVNNCYAAALTALEVNVNT